MNAPPRSAPAVPAHRTAQAEAWEALALIAHRPPCVPRRTPTPVTPAAPDAPDAAAGTPAG